MKSPKSILFLVLLILFIFSVTNAETKYSELESKVDSFLKPVVEQDLISGSVLIAQKGEILLAKGYGLANREQDIPNTVDTKFRLGSMTKQFTAAAIMILEERGRLSINDTLSKFYPDYPNGNKITLHHLLTHTSGIVNFTEIAKDAEKYVLPYSIDEVISWFKDQPLQFEPGEKFAYSNSGYVLLAGIIEQVSKTSYSDFLRTNIFEPLGMNNTGQDVFTTVVKKRATGHLSFGFEVEQVYYRDMKNMSGAGSLYSTPMDFYRWDQALYTDKLLSKASQDKMFTPYQGNYGYGWFIENRNGHKAISHRGEISGFIGSIERYPNDSLLVVAMFNYESTFARAAIKGLSEIALGLEPKPLLVQTPPTIDTVVLNSYSGMYRFDETDTLKVSVEENKLYVMGFGSKEKLSALPQKEHVFFVRGLNALIKFEVNAEGKANSLILVNSVHTYKAVRIL
jgi:CubicO group peptidase (beta-lactamase class C family)